VKSLGPTLPRHWLTNTVRVKAAPHRLPLEAHVAERAPEENRQDRDIGREVVGEQVPAFGARIRRSRSNCRARRRPSASRRDGDLISNVPTSPEAIG
jgi:hypothetical protein